MHAVRLNELITALQQADTVEAIHGIGCDICSAYGFEYFLYAASVPLSFVAPKVLFISGYPQEWREHYNQNGYTRIDPTVHHCLQHITPLNWVDLSALKSENPSICKLMDEAETFGLRTGLTFPVHGAHGELAMLNFAHSLAPDRYQAELITNMAALQLLSAFFHEAVRRVLQVVILPTAQTPLSQRENQCLLWAAEGKTSWETSQILGVAERTVVFHLQNAQEKLQVNNRQHAVARAVALGIITPDFH